MKFEPVLNAQIISTFVAAIIACLVAFNVPITNDQRIALLSLVGAICAIFFGGAVVARNNVYPVEKVEDEIVPEAFRAGINSARLGDAASPGGVRTYANADAIDARMGDIPPARPQQGGIRG